MPSVQFQLKDLEHLVGTSLPRDREGLNKIVAYVKADVESIESEGGNINVSIEIKDSNHPDIWCVEGIARALRGFMRHLPAKQAKVVRTSGMTVHVDKGLRDVRPYIACALIRDIHTSEEALKSWIGLQEKMDQTYGRKRRKSSIGFYRASQITPPLHYTVSKPDETSFVPLGGTKSMTLREIIENHPKGIEYGATISRHSEWPVLLDDEDRVLSFPPIINSNDLGHITPDSRHVLVEVTGTDVETVQNTLKIVATTLAERGGEIHSCTQKYAYYPTKSITPNLKETPFQLSVEFTNHLLGTTLQSKQLSSFLKNAGFPVRKTLKDTITVGVPSYRLDIMHQVDVIEDVAIAMDVNNLKPEWPNIFTPGALAPQTGKLDNVAELMVGLGFQEVMTYSFGSEETLFKRMNLHEEGQIELLNPSMSNYTTLRPWLLPSLLEFLSNNTHVEYPQRIFEVGRCFDRSNKVSSGVRDTPKLCAVTIHATAGFTEIKQSLDAILRSIGTNYTVQSSKHPSMLDGRTGEITRGDGSTMGIIGEVNPKVIKEWGLSLPVGMFELDLSLAIAPGI